MVATGSHIGQLGAGWAGLLGSLRELQVRHKRLEARIVADAVKRRWTLAQVYRPLVEGLRESLEAALLVLGWCSLGAGVLAGSALSGQADNTRPRIESRTRLVTPLE